MHNVTVYTKDNNAPEYIEGVVGQAGNGALVQFEQYNGNQILIPVDNVKRIEATPVSDDEEVLSSEQTKEFLDWYIPALDKAKARFEEEKNADKTH